MVADAVPCGTCCLMSTYSIRIEALDATFAAFPLIQSAILVVSMLALLYRLNRTYRSSYDAHQRPMRRLLQAAALRKEAVDSLETGGGGGSSDSGAGARGRGHARGGAAGLAASTAATPLLGPAGSGARSSDDTRSPDGLRDSMGRRVDKYGKPIGGGGGRASTTSTTAPRRRQGFLVLPTYYTYTQCAALLFIVEAILYLPANSPAVIWLRFVSFAACSFFDNFVIAFLVGSGGNAMRAAAASAFICCLYLVFVAAVPTSATCQWCGVHIPKPGIEFPYFVAAASYFGLAWAARTCSPTPESTAWMERGRDGSSARGGCAVTLRPALVGWGCTIGVAYLLAALGVFILHELRLDIGYCFLNAGILEYSVLYAPMLYRTFVKDTAYCSSLDTLRVLNRMNVPLVAPGEASALPGPGDGPGPDGEGAGGGGGAGVQAAAKTGGWARTLGVRVSVELRALLEDPSINIIPAADLELGRRVGVGGYGSVHRARWLGADVAVKQLFAFSSGGTAPGARLQAMEDFLKEARVLSGLRHPNIVLMLGVCVELGNQAIVTEFVDGGSVFDEVQHARERRLGGAGAATGPGGGAGAGAGGGAGAGAGGGAAAGRDLGRGVRHTGAGLGTERMLSILVQCARGVAYLHNRRPSVIHRDLKSPNLLVAKDTGTVKVTDFGLSRVKEATATLTAVGTCQWTAPEVLRRDMYSEKADVWSLGVIIWELCALDIPFRGMSAIRVAAGVAYQGLRLTVPARCPAFLADLMQKCFQTDPADRPTFAAISSALLAEQERRASLSAADLRREELQLPEFVR